MSTHFLVRAARGGDAPAIARVHVESWRTTYRGLLPEHVLDSLDVAEREKTWDAWLAAAATPGRALAIHVLESAGEVVGFASAGPSRTAESSHELYAIYLLATAQRRGGGALLFHATVESLRRLGAESLVAWVLEGNPAASFYAALGGTRAAERLEDLRGVRVKEIAYVWQPLP